MDAELRVRVLQMLAHRVRRDVQQAGGLAIRPALCDQEEDLALARCQTAVGSRPSPSPNPHEVRQQQVEDRPVPLAEIATAAIELEAGPGDAGLEPESHHVLDPERPVSELVELGTVVFAACDEVRSLSRAEHDRDRVLVSVPQHGSTYLVRHRRAGLPGECDRRPAERLVLVVRHDIARNEAAERSEDGLSEGIGPVGRGALADHVEHAPVIGPREPSHRKSIRRTSYSSIRRAHG